VNSIQISTVTSTAMSSIPLLTQSTGALGTGCVGLQYLSIYNGTASGFPPQPAVQYRPPPLGFNAYLNGSDLVEQFIKWCGEQGVRRGEFARLPIELFVRWLIIEATKADGLAAEGEPQLITDILAYQRKGESDGEDAALSSAAGEPVVDPDAGDTGGGAGRDGQPDGERTGDVIPWRERRAA
jgi:hypothetical protein